MSIEKLGLSHSLPEDSEIVHSTVMGVNCLGRITDLLSAWCKNTIVGEYESLSDFRLLLQALLEFSCYKTENFLGQIEWAGDSKSLFVAVRFPCQTRVQPETIEKDLTQFWLNAPEVKLLKKMLYPQDRVEVRYHLKMNLIEWRICRPKKINPQAIDHAGFKVYVDSALGLDAGDAHFRDLGDLPFMEWLSEAYQNKHVGSRAGQITVEGESQENKEWARVVVDREKQEIEDELERIFKTEKFEEESADIQFGGSNVLPINEETIAFKSRSSDIPVEVIIREHNDSAVAAKEVDRQIQKLEWKLVQEKLQLEQQKSRMEDLLRRKEYINQRHMAEIIEIQAQLIESKKNQDTGKGEHFRQKAVEMFEMLKKVKEEKAELEKLINDSRRKDNSEGFEGPFNQNLKALDESVKKSERLQRAFDAEKVKLKTLSERVMIAEKEAQAAGPIIEDLESKVEHTLKTVQQHKKETEQVKQKLVQSDAEKNRIKNDLIKANAQIQTLMKRQAS
jgi:hypothetical protein